MSFPGLLASAPLLFPPLNMSLRYFLFTICQCGLGLLRQFLVIVLFWPFLYYPVTGAYFTNLLR